MQTGRQTIEAINRVGSSGYVIAADISESMLQHLRRKAESFGLRNISMLNYPAENLNVEPESFDARILFMIEF